MAYNKKMTRATRELLTLMYQIFHLELNPSLGNVLLPRHWIIPIAKDMYPEKITPAAYRPFRVRGNVHRFKVWIEGGFYLDVIFRVKLIRPDGKKYDVAFEPCTITFRRVCINEQVALQHREQLTAQLPSGFQINSSIYSREPQGDFVFGTSLIYSLHADTFKKRTLA